MMEEILDLMCDPNETQVVDSEFEAKCEKLAHVVIDSMDYKDMVEYAESQLYEFYKANPDALKNDWKGLYGEDNG